MTPLIQGKSIDLKLIDESDIELLREWRNSKEVSDYMLTRTIITKEQQLVWFNKIKDDSSCINWIILSKEGKKMGMAGLSQIDRDTKSAVPGLYIGNEKFRNSFFGIEANYKVLSYSFNELGLEKISGTVLSSNSVALKMNLSFGYEIHTLLKDEIIIDGIGQDVFKIVLFKKNFHKSKMANFFKR